MKQFNLIDGGVHSFDDLRKRYQGTVVYGCIADQDAKPYYIKEIDGSTLYLWNNQNDGNQSVKADKFFLIQDRPHEGIYNFRAKKRPYRVVADPKRQWKWGWNLENRWVHTITGIALDPINVDATNQDLSDRKDFYEPWYPPLTDAIDMLDAGLYKHLAINNSISIMKKGPKLTVLKNFVPFLAFVNGVCFKIPPLDALLIKDYREYANLLKHPNT